MTKTYQSAGDYGDCIFQCCAIRALGGGTLLLHAERWTREPMTQRKVDSLRTLLITQPYIKDVRWLRPGEKVDCNLNDFRSEYFRTFRHPNFPKQRNLCEWILRTHGVDPAEQNKAWLTISNPLKPVAVVINRTSRYQNPQFPWKKVLQKYNGFVGFVGTQAEHEAFCATVKSMRLGYEFLLPHIDTPDLLTLARVIAGADLFIGNQSLPYAIAEGLKKRAVLEVCPGLPNCLFQRVDCIHGWGADVELPEL